MEDANDDVLLDLDVFIYTNENDIQHDQDETVDMIDLHSLDSLENAVVDSIADIVQESTLENLGSVVVHEEAMEIQEMIETVVHEEAPEINQLVEPTILDKTLEIPDIIFIVPYRDRKDDLAYFLKQMHTILATFPHILYEIKIMHQNDERPFNRGAIKNLGFLYAKEKYPTEYKKITFVFNDVDTTPTAPIFNYVTVPGTIKHFYGFTFALGGILSIAGEDFETIGGFPNFWQWGFEDNLLQERALAANLNIDRSEFKEIGDSTVNQLSKTPYKNMNRRDLQHYQTKTKDGISSIYDIAFVSYFLPDVQIEEKHRDGVEFVDINAFSLAYNYDMRNDFVHDVRNKLIPGKNGAKLRGIMPILMEKNATLPLPTKTDSPLSVMKHHTTIKNSKYKMRFV